MLTEDWLIKTNIELSKNNIKHLARPMAAISAYAKEFKIPVGFNSQIALKISDWFKSNTRQDTGLMAALFESTYFYDGEFWVLDIPFFWGSVKLEPFNSLKNMPDSIKERLINDSDYSIDFVRHWANCFDLGLGYNEISQTMYNIRFGLGFFKAGIEELQSAATLLREHKLNSRILQNSRMAVEMFFKSYAALRNKLNDEEARKISHDLTKGLEKLVIISGNQKYTSIASELSVYPLIKDRYVAQNASTIDLWNAFRLAQKIGAIVARELSSFDALSEIESKIV